MSTTETLIAIDRRLAAGRGADYDEILHEDAVVIVPGAILDKAACVAAMDDSPGWDAFEIEDVRTLETAATTTIVYSFSGRRGTTDYRATLASTYVAEDAGWRLLLHQHTPADAEPT